MRVNGTQSPHRGMAGVHRYGLTEVYMKVTGKEIKLTGEED